VARADSHPTTSVADPAPLWKFYLADPYCIIDATCVSSFYVPEQASYKNHWQGLAWLGDDYDRSFLQPNGLYYLAVPNYVAFLCLLFGCALLVMRSRRAGVRRFGIAFLIAWASCDAISTVGYAASLTTTPRDAALGIMLLLLALSIASIAAAARWSRATVSSKPQ
jgi:hypothetical protein